MSELKRVTLRVQVTVDAVVPRRDIEAEIVRMVSKPSGVFGYIVPVDAYARVMQEDPAHLMNHRTF